MNLKERTEYSLGEEFKFEKIKLKCVEGVDCDCHGCYFEEIGCIPTLCSSDRRRDGLDVIFVEAEEEVKPVLKNSHYTGGKADVIDLALTSGDAEGFFATSAMKYIQRRKLKGSEIDDVIKAFDYITMLLLDIHDIDSEILKTIIEKRKGRK